MHDSISEGLTIGFAYVAPIGMQNVFVINSAVSRRLPKALITPLIVAFFNITLACACFFGIGMIIERHEWVRLAVSAFGSLIIILIGIRLLMARPGDISKAEGQASVARTISTACLVTWLNPQAIIDGTMMLGAFRAALEPGEAAAFIIRVSCASLSWFHAVTIAVSLFSNRLTTRVMRTVNIICGGIIIIYGLRLLLDAIPYLAAVI